MLSTTSSKKGKARNDDSSDSEGEKVGEHDTGEQRSEDVDILAMPISPINASA